MLCLLISASAVRSYAQAQDGSDAGRAASARLLFEQGVNFAERGDWSDAEDRFRRALSLRVSPVIAYNLASALSEQGKLIEASEMVRRVLADGNADPELRQAASQLSQGLSERIGRVLIQVRGQQLGDRVVLDGSALHAAQINVEIPSDPGAHQLRLERAGKTIDMRSFTLAPGGSEVLVLKAPPLMAAPESVAGSELQQPAAVASTAAEPPVHAKQPSLLTRWWFWTGAVAVVAAGAAVGIAAASGISHAQTPYQGNVSPGSVAVEVAP
jgi:hypothetical protein